MKRTILAVILIIFAGLSVYGQNTSPIDLVLLLDTSSGMSSSYENVNNYITGSFLSEYLRVGDTFHLIAFSGSPRLDAARRIKDIGDVETIIGRMLLQYPVESGNNAGAALTYAERYISSLPTRPKKIVLVSIGGSDTSSLVSASRQRLGSNTSIDFVQVVPGQPLTNLPSSGRPVAAPAITQTTAPQQTTTTPPSAAQPPARTVTSPSETTPSTQNNQNNTVTPPPSQRQTTAPSGTADPSRTTGGPVTTTRQDTTSQDRTTAPGVGTTTVPSGTAPSEQPSQSTTPSEGRTQDSVSTDNAVGSREAQETEGYLQRPGDRTSSAESLASSMPLMIGIVILALLVLGLIIFAASRRLGSSPNRVMAQVASSSSSSGSGSTRKEEPAPFVDHSKDLSRYAASQNKQRTTPYTDRPVKPEANKPVVINPSGPLLLNLFVEDQNTAIGKRNIHSLKSGYSLSVGGGKSDYLIFLVPIPANIGEIRRDGSQCTFIPRKPKYFPDIGANEVRDCINKTIRIVSDKNYEMRFRFEMYEDPLIAINRTLMSIKVPG